MKRPSAGAELREPSHWQQKEIPVGCWQNLKYVHRVMAKGLELLALSAGDSLTPCL